MVVRATSPAGRQVRALTPFFGNRRGVDLTQIRPFRAALRHVDAY
jgi:hypothetical protein